MNAFDVLMANPQNREDPPKKRLCKRARAQTQPQRSLMVHIRPPTWMAQPLDLDADIVTVIVEVLMRSEDWRKARHIKALALVNRTCAAAVESTLDRVRAQLKHNAFECGLARRAQVLRLRRNGVLVKSTEVLAEEANRLYEIHDAYMKEVGIPPARRMALAPFADRTWFHDNVSLLGHLGNACELCNGPMHVQTRDSGYSFRDGPVMLIACGRCKSKACVDLTLSYADATGQVLKAHIEQLETPANNYARALLSKQAAHLKRMRSKRPTRVMPAKLGKRVHRVDVTDEMSLCYWNSTHRMSQGPWHLELWHTLPAGLPEQQTFGTLMGVRDSEAVRDESRAHAKWLQARRAAAGQKRAALSKLLTKFSTERKMVALVVRAGHFDGWVQAIDLCTTARAFEVRWMFRWQQIAATERLPSAWREQMYELLEMDEAVLAAGVKRVATVAELLCKTFCRTTLPLEQWKYKTSQRDVTLELLRNFPSWFLDRGATQVDVVVDRLSRANVRLEMRTTSTGFPTLVVNYTLAESDGPWRRVQIVNYWSDYTVRRMAKSIGFFSTLDRVTPKLLEELESWANRPQVSCHKNQAIRNQARTAIFGLPAAWPEYIFS